MDNTVALGSTSVTTCTACAMLSHPALRCCLERGHELLSHGFGHQTSDHVNHYARHSSVGLLQRCHFSSLEASRVFLLPDASGDPSNAWRAAEISPLLINASTRSTLFFTVHPGPSPSGSQTCCILRRFLALAQQVQPLTANLLNLSNNSFFGTLPPRAGRNKKILGSKMNIFPTFENPHSVLQLHATDDLLQRQPHG